MENDAITFADFAAKIDRLADALDAALVNLAGELSDLADIAIYAARRDGHSLDAKQAQRVRNACDKVSDQAMARMDERRAVSDRQRD